MRLRRRFYAVFKSPARTSVQARTSTYARKGIQSCACAIADARACVRARAIAVSRDINARAIAQGRIQAWRCRCAPARAQPIEACEGKHFAPHQRRRLCFLCVRASSENAYLLSLLAVIQCDSVLISVANFMSPIGDYLSHCFSGEVPS